MSNAQVYITHTISVEHLTRDLTNLNTEGYAADISLSGVMCNIQPAGQEVAMLYGGAYGKSYSLFTTNSGILETDRVTISGTSTKYIVKGVKKFDYGIMQHLEYLIEQIL
jgi:hypothetical protein